MYVFYAVEKNGVGCVDVGGLAGDVRARFGGVGAARTGELATTGASDVLADADAVLRADSIASFVDIL